MDDNGTGCCTPDALDQIRSLYTELALRPDKEFGWGKGKGNARQLGYADEWLARLPDVVWESAAAVGNPFAVGPVHPGETVVDLGCGAGADACVAALMVGDTGKVYGFDATPAMVTKATSNAKAAGLCQIEFREADMIHLGLPDAVADVVISNGAINLTLDKPKVFAEIFRILRRGGRFQFADMVREHGATAACCGESAWADCISGTMGVEEIKNLLHEAGFVNVQLVELTGYKTSLWTVGATFNAHKAQS
jgi:SAM-dependent methyltransferase